MVFISVIVPVFNRKKYIRRCIDSILEQTFSDYEVIIVDDGSCDGTEKVCDEYAKRYDNIKVIHQKNGGVSKARNEGLKAAKGQYVTFIDSDDYIPRDYLQKTWEACDKYGQKMIYCNSFIVDTESGSEYYRHKNNKEYSVVENNVLPVFEAALFNTVINKVYSMSMIKKYVIRFPENLNLGEDVIFNLCYMDRQDEISFLLLNKNFYHQCRKKRKSALEDNWRSDYFEIQKFLLREKIKYINKWIDEGKLEPRNRKIFPSCYYDCISESIKHSIANRKQAGAVTIVKQLMEIAHSPEYTMCVQLNQAKKGFFVRIIYHTCRKEM